jgi:uncharacterized coiled-coil protein SlyX
VLFALLTVGSIAQWLTVLTIGVLAVVLVRGGGAGAVTILQASNEVLERRIHEQDKTISELTAQVADLQARTDVTIALRPILEWMHAHEQRDQERFERTLDRLDRFADTSARDAPPAV